MADVDCERFGEGRGEGDSAALAGDFGVAIFIFDGFDFCGWRLGGLVSMLLLLLLSRENTRRVHVRVHSVFRNMRWEIWSRAAVDSYRW